MVLSGALSLALPTKLGQRMNVKKTDRPTLRWNAKVRGEDWFSAQFSLPDLVIQSSNIEKVGERLLKIILITKELAPDFLSDGAGYEVETNLEFDAQWGLGSSSSLLSNIAYWADCNPYRLNKKVFKGSGYDIACARSDAPILYHFNTKGKAQVEVIDFNPSFADQLYLVWLKQKQNTFEEITRYAKGESHSKEIEVVNAITIRMQKCNDLTEFKTLMEDHENLISHLIKMAKVKETLFPDFDGAIKSLGAWGGDFVLAASSQSFDEVEKYFKQKGYNTVFRYRDLIK